MAEREQTVAVLCGRCGQALEWTQSVTLVLHDDAGPTLESNWTTLQHGTVEDCLRALVLRVTTLEEKVRKLSANQFDMRLLERR